MPDDSRIAEAFRRFIRAEVYLPFPAAIALLFALVVFTASLTVIVTLRPARAPDLPENPRIAGLEAALASPRTLSALTEAPFRNAREAGAPLAALELAGETAPAVPARMQASPRLMPARHAKAAVGPDLAASAALSRNEVAASATPDVAPRNVGRMLPPSAPKVAAVAGMPVAELNLAPAAEPELVAKMDARSILLPQKHANALPAPERLTASVLANERAARPRPEDNPFPSEDGKAWRKFAAAVPSDADGKPKIVIVLDDLGNAPAMTAALAALEGPLTFAFLPYAGGLAEQTRMVRAKGHELMVHLPMEPQGNERPGPHALYSSLSDQELASALAWNLSQFEGYVGVNNHMGSALTEDARVMRLILAEIKVRGLLFLDSLTTAKSVAGKVAASLDIPTAVRDVFLDNEATDTAIQAQLMVLERTAREQGFAIAIGHPNRATLRALQSWIPSARARGFALVPLSAVVELEGKRRLAAAGGN